MRILVLGDARQPHTRRWIQALQESGSEVVAASMESPGEPLPCPFHLLPASGPGFLRHRAALPPLLAIARGFKPRCITSLFVPDYGFLGARLRKSMGPDAGPSLCVAALGSDLLINAHRTPLHRLRARWVLQQADVVAVDARVLAEAAISLGACFNAACLYVLIRRAGHYVPEADWGAFLLKLVVALYLMGGAILYTMGIESSWFEIPAGRRALRLALVIAAGAATYFATLAAMGMRPRHFTRHE